MWLRSWYSISNVSSVSSSSSPTCWPFSNPTKPQHIFSTKPTSFAKPRRPSSTNTALRAQLSDQIAQIVHNKVLISAGVSAAIGQLFKPFASVFLYGKDFDIRATVQAGGFPSSHSSAVVAAATCLGLERGLSDSIFGMTVVYAGIIMYDSQGVRREVGIHARTLNNMSKAKARPNSIPIKDADAFNSQPGTSPSPRNYSSDESYSFASKASSNTVLVSMSEKKAQMRVSSGLEGEADEGLDRIPDYPSLKESIGHTEVEVIAGALLGFLVSLAVNNLT